MEIYQFLAAASILISLMALFYVNNTRELKKKIILYESERDTVQKSKVEMESRIRQLTELNFQKDMLLRVVTHDIRNPMSTMVSLIEVLEDDMDGMNPYGDDSKELVGAVKEQINKTYKIVEELLGRAGEQRIEKIYKPESLELSRAVDEVLSLINAGAESIDLKVNNDIPGTISVFCDKEMLKLILWYLLSYAIKFSDTGDTIILGAYQNENEAIISIKSHGIGVDFGKAARFFEEDNSYCDEDMENEELIGLLICKKFAAQNGGKIWIDGKAGKGNAFCFSLSSTFV